VQMLPVVLLPQFLLCGFIVPREELPDFLRWVSDLLPLSYAVDATKALTITGETGADYWRPLAIVAAFVVGLLILGSATLRRRTP
jgi:ABC-2 type transport system permease protein